MARRTPIVAGAIFVLVLVLGVAIFRAGRSNSPEPANPARPTVVLYSVTDRETAQELIDQFEAETGIRVEAKFDTEAAKAVGLVQAIRQEKANPRCDVLWGGGAFFHAMLANDGCLAPAPADLIKAQGTAPRDAQGRWLGFAAAYRVLIVNTDVFGPQSRPHSYRDLAAPRYKGRVGIANPLFGGMAAHVTALFQVLGPDRARRWLSDLKANDCALCGGMADVTKRVASGELWFGITSSIDAHVAVDDGKPVAVVIPDQEPGEIGCMEGFSSVALVADAPHPKEAERLLRFLMSAKTEEILAAGPAQTVGMLPESVARDVRPPWIPPGIRAMDVDWAKAAKSYSESTKAIKEILLGR
ncbi:extracellular solute-binding protein [Singulisphaera acidiphila]|uniref:ABC-type Fe3+ transport system, periplasmic component n=1 Tax=Singulisphaera acidiphila (strain ATCC BAA-1392 / DSM 18658 / VKM B-2454 / MOB10) TaxID=886293 RepID=L0DAL5_SINAD|nr:extracellular solute-binding protein [Singulisphaera acidiphila]AGA26409.1 ABC-type Fe3+ transport system, periplasmic component [Singulisphaera acidiphila DSM 18658]